MWGRRLATIVSAALLGGLLLLAITRSVERGRFAVPYSSYGAGPRGAQGLFMLADALGGQPARWVEDLAGLPDGGLLVALGGCDGSLRRGLSRYEQLELANWVTRGGHVLLAGAHEYLPDTFGVQLLAPPECDAAALGTGDGAAASDGVPVDDGLEAREAPADPGDVAGTHTDQTYADAGQAIAGDPSAASADIVSADIAEGSLEDFTVVAAPAPAGLLGGLGGLPLVMPGELVTETDLEHTVLASAPDAPDMPFSTVQSPLIVHVPYGRGSVTVVAAATPFENRYLDSGEGGVVFARLLGAIRPAGPVLFDEYHLGVGERRSAVRYLRQRGLAPVLVQLALLALLLLLRVGARFGAIERAAPEPPPGTRSFVSALGHLFAQSRDREAAGRLLAQDARRRVAEHYHLSARTSDGLCAELTSLGQHEAADAVQAIDAALGAGTDSLTELCATLDAAIGRACRAA